MPEDGYFGADPFDFAQGRHYYRWKRKYAGMGVAELRRLKRLEEENRRVKQLVADVTLDKLILKEAAEGNF